MSVKSSTATTRAYRKRRRAELEEKTRLRITEAAVELHGTLGPARTTVSAVASRSKVQRATVYRHFPDEESLFAACSSHFMAANPLPDPEPWTEIRDVDQRLGIALEELYGWYRRTEWMIEKTTRDAPLVAAMRAPMEAFAAYLAAARDALVRGRPELGARRRRVSAVIGHALEFDTWRSLVRGHGLSDAEAVELMARVAAATRC